MKGVDDRLSYPGLLIQSPAGIRRESCCFRASLTRIATTFPRWIAAMIVVDLPSSRWIDFRRMLSTDILLEKSAVIQWLIGSQRSGPAAIFSRSGEQGNFRASAALASDSVGDVGEASIRFDSEWTHGEQDTFHGTIAQQARLLSKYRAGFLFSIGMACDRLMLGIPPKRIPAGTAGAAQVRWS